MLLVPMVRQVDDVSVFQDDTVWHRFYLVPARPSVRREDDGRPVFMLATYTIDADDRARDPSLPVGGGYLNFDTVFDVAADQREAVRSEMQTWVDGEHGRRVAAGEAPGPAPTVEFADPLISGGTVRLSAPTSANLVHNLVGEAPASLTVGSTAVFSMDLTEQGASFMKGILVDEDGAAQLDLTPFGVTYELWMWARLPPVRITVTAESERVHEIIQKISEANRDDPCTPSEIETYRENGTSSSQLTESGVVDVKLDDGNAALPDDVKMALQEYALNLFDTMVKDRFLSPVSLGHADELGFDDEHPALASDRQEPAVAVLFEHADYKGRSIELTSSADHLGDLNNKVSSVQLRRGAQLTLHEDTNLTGNTLSLRSSTRHVGGRFNDRASSARLWVPPTTRYRMRRSIDHTSMDLSITVERSSVVEWPVVAQSTLARFFTGMPSDEVAKHVVAVPLDDFRTLGVSVGVFADFTGPVRGVEVECAYASVDDAGEEQLQVAPAMTFTETDQVPKLFDANVIDGNREYQHRHRVIYEDGTTTQFTPWTTASGRSLNIAIEDPGKVELQMSAAALNWELVKACTVTASHRSEDGEVDVARTFELTAATPSALWTQQFTRELVGEVELAVRYLLVDQQVIEGETQRVPVNQNLVAVPQPQVDVLDVSLVPSGDWTDVARVLVSARYDAGNGRVLDKVFTFSAVDQMEQWQVLLEDSSRRTFEYKVLATYTTGAPAHETDWIAMEGDQAVAISAFTPPKLKVQVLPSLIDFERTPAVTVRFEYGDATETLALVDGETQVFVTPRRADGNTSYSYTITYHTAAGGDPLVVGPTVTTETALVIPAAQLTNKGQLRVVVRGFALDFAATPFVDVVLTWSDGAREDSEHIVLSQAATDAEWVLDIGDRTQRSYRYAVTYNLASGELVEGPSGSQDTPMLSVPPLAVAPPTPVQPSDGAVEPAGPPEPPEPSQPTEPTQPTEPVEPTEPTGGPGQPVTPTEPADPTPPGG